MGARRGAIAAGPIVLGYLPIAFSFVACIAVVGSGMRVSIRSSCSSPSTTFIVALSLIPLDKGRGGIVRESCLGGAHKFRQLKLGVF